MPFFSIPNISPHKSIFTITHFLEVDTEVIILSNIGFGISKNLFFIKIMNIEVCEGLTSQICIDFSLKVTLSK
jgi:hypothetical protein